MYVRHQNILHPIYVRHQVNGAELRISAYSNKARDQSVFEHSLGTMHLKLLTEESLSRAFWGWTYYMLHTLSRFNSDSGWRKGSFTDICGLESKKKYHGQNRFSKIITWHLLKFFTASFFSMARFKMAKWRRKNGLSWTGALINISISIFGG